MMAKISSMAGCVVIAAIAMVGLPATVSAVGVSEFEPRGEQVAVVDAEAAKLVIAARRKYYKGGRPKAGSWKNKARKRVNCHAIRHSNPAVQTKLRRLCLEGKR